MPSLRILILGATEFQIAPIRYARESGYHVITCDNKPENPGHALSHETHNVSTTDRGGVLDLARRSRIDGILAFASDPAAATASYVASSLGLPGNPLSAVETLSTKDRFRAFLRQNGFHAPRFITVVGPEEAIGRARGLTGRIIVKPVDSSGSKGVGIVDDRRELPGAVENALAFSRSSKAIIEEWVDGSGWQIAGDGFVVDGILVFCSLARENFDEMCNPVCPVGESFPLEMPSGLRVRIEAEIQRVLSLLGYRSGAINLDILVAEGERIVFLEIGPRSGGNFIPEIIKLTEGMDLVAASVDHALGTEKPFSAYRQPDGTHAFASSYILHSRQNGVFRGVEIAEEIKSRVLKCVLFKKPGDPISRFNGSDCGVGASILSFTSREEMHLKMENMHELLRVVI